MEIRRPCSSSSQTPSTVPALPSVRTTAFPTSSDCAFSNALRITDARSFAGMSPANCMRRTGPLTLIRERGYTRSFAGRCGRRYALPVDQRLKLLGNLHIQIDDAFIAFALAAIPASDRKETIFLGVVEDREQLAFGIDQHRDGSVLWKRWSLRNCSMLNLLAWMLLGRL